MPGINKYHLSASATVENAVLIPLTVVIILICLKMNITAYNHVAAQSAGMRGALKAGQEELDDEESQTLSQQISETADRLLLMLPAAEAEVFQDNSKVGVRIRTDDWWKIPYFSDLSEFSQTEQFSSRKPADFIRLTHTISKQLDAFSGDKENGIHD